MIRHRSLQSNHICCNLSIFHDQNILCSLLIQYQNNMNVGMNLQSIGYYCKYNCLHQCIHRVQSMHIRSMDSHKSTESFRMWIHKIPHYIGTNLDSNTFRSQNTRTFRYSSPYHIGSFRIEILHILNGKCTNLLHHMFRVQSRRSKNRLEYCDKWDIGIDLLPSQDHMSMYLEHCTIHVPSKYQKNHHLRYFFQSRLERCISHLIPRSNQRDSHRNLRADL